MKKNYNLSRAGNNLNFSVVAIGTFDGVHCGHRAIIKRAVLAAKKKKTASVVITFDKQPASVTGRGSAETGMIYDINRKKEIILSLGIDLIIVINFVRSFADVSPEEFVERIIAKRLKAVEVVVGSDFHFGKDRKGNVSLLKVLGANFGYKVTSVPMLSMGSGRISSTRIRKLIYRGKVEEASELLGSPYTLTGKVVRGAGRGRKLEYPTANLQFDNKIVLPSGVFEVSARVKGKSYQGLANIGYRPTFEKKPGKKLITEVNLLDFSGSLYGERMSISFTRKIRAERKFTGGDELSEQIKRDVNGLLLKRHNTRSLVYSVNEFS